MPNRLATDDNEVWQKIDRKDELILWLFGYSYYTTSRSIKKRLSFLAKGVLPADKLFKIRITADKNPPLFTLTAATVKFSFA